MRSGGVPEALGKGLGPILDPKGAPWTKMIKKGDDLHLPGGQVGGKNSHFSDILALILALIFRGVFGKASGSVFG